MMKERILNVKLFLLDSASSCQLDPENERQMETQKAAVSRIEIKKRKREEQGKELEKQESLIKDLEDELEIIEAKLNSAFESTIAIQDTLLSASLLGDKKLSKNDVFFNYMI